MGDPLFVLTNDVLDGWKAEKDAAERMIAEGQRRLADVRHKLEAVAVLTGRPVADAPQLFEVEPKPKETADDPTNMVAAVLEIVGDAERPLSKKVLRSMLRKRGFPEERLGNYFYTVIHRLKGKGRITLSDDGSIWKGERDAA